MKKNNKKAFSIIEILIWMVIFLIWISAIYSTIVSTLNLNESNKNYIIWVNLAREQLELFRNIRDTNFAKQKGFNNTSPKDCSSDSTNISEKCEKFVKWKIYKISNDFSWWLNFTVKTEEWRNISKPYKIEDLKDFQVCIDKTKNLYDYCSDISLDKKELKMFKFIEISQVENYEMKWVSGSDKKIDEKDALKVTSKVIWYTKRWQEFEVSSIFTNYKN